MISGTFIGCSTPLAQALLRARADAIIMVPMQTRGKIFEDISKVAQGATQSLIGVRAEIEAVVRGQMSHLMGDMDVVPRDEFDAVKAMAAKAREENAALEARLKKLEAAVKAPAKKAAPKKAAAKKTAAKT